MDFYQPLEELGVGEGSETLVQQAANVARLSLSSESLTVFENLATFVASRVN